MTKMNIKAGLFILVISSLLLAACGGAGQPTTAPTVDANLIYTQAAQTVAANTQKTQAAQPPATATTQPSATPEPTKAVDPDTAAAQTATANAILNPNTNTTPAANTTPGANTTPVVVIPTATKPVVVNKPPATTADKCQWISNYPADNSQITKSASFDASIKVKNTGTTTWTTKYALRYFGGERMGTPDSYLIQREVKPNDTYTWTFTMTAPNSTGKKEVLLVVQNPDGQNMCMINMPLDIVP